MKISCAFDGTPYRDPGGEAKVALCAHGFCLGRRDWPFLTLRNHSNSPHQISGPPIWPAKWLFSPQKNRGPKNIFWQPKKT